VGSRDFLTLSACLRVCVCVCVLWTHNNNNNNNNNQGARQAIDSHFFQPPRSVNQSTINVWITTKEKRGEEKTSIEQSHKPRVREKANSSYLCVSSCQCLFLCQRDYEMRRGV